ncbi:MAG: hypothetical protein L6R37_007649 [Teloschistes peruensis]|nr:MAG: hypothetical protein L6R37_007649 [Teloschistes peruensis]
MEPTAAQHTPPDSPASPTASFYDLSDGEEGEYNTIMHSNSGRGVKLLFSKSKVYVHPTPSSKDNIPGFIALIQQKEPPTSPLPTADRDRRTSTASSSSRTAKAASYLLAWLPESSLGGAYDAYLKVEVSDSSSPPRQTFLVPPPPTTTHSTNIGTYAFAVPVSDIYSLLVRPPSIGWWYGSVVINTRTGNSLPALFFHDDECQSTILQKKKRVKESFNPFSDQGGTFWGGDEVLRWLKRYVVVEKSGADPSVFLVEPTAEDKLGFGGKLASPKNSDASSAKAITGQKGTAPSASGSGGRDAGMDPVTKALKQARWSFLEKMSQVTTFTRRTAQDIAENPKIPPQVRRLMKNPEVQTLQDEFDSARVYLARWAMGMAEQSEKERSQRIFTAQDVLEMEESEVGQFEILDAEAASLSMQDKRKPVTMTEWKGYFDESGKMKVTVDEVKERIFLGGLDPADGVRKEAWLFLLGFYDWTSNATERKTLLHNKRDEFIKLKGAWWDRMVDGTGTPEENEWWKEQKGRIEKDVHRTDRNIPLFEGEDIPHPDPDSPFAEVGTNVHLEQMKDMLLTYNEYNKNLGYVQGMSDLLAPIYAVEQDDAIAFWGFVGFMDRMERNFLRDQSGMRTQLLTLDHLVQLMDPALYLHLQKADSTNFFFFFRMLLVWYKREFQWTDVLRLWESLWTDHLSSNFHLFIALAILEKHRDVMMEHLKHFDEVLKYVNELSNSIDLSSTLLRAQFLFRRFQRTVEAIDRKQSFPAPSAVRQRKPVPAPPTSSTSNSNSNNNTPATRNTAAAGKGSAQNSRRNGNGKNATSSGSDADTAGGGGRAGISDGEAERRVVSPELRGLLRREVERVGKGVA